MPFGMVSVVGREMGVLDGRSGDGQQLTAISSSEFWAQRW